MPHRTPVQATYLTAEVLIRVIHVPLVMEEDKTNIGTEAELFPACIAGNRAATIHVLHLEGAAEMLTLNSNTLVHPRQ